MRWWDFPEPRARSARSPARRVAILRCVLADADLLLFDEPLRGMDEGTVGDVMRYVMPRLDGRTVLWVTHDDRELAFFSDPVCWCVEGGSVERRTAHRCPHVR